MKRALNQKDIMQALDTIYVKAINGIMNVSPPIEVLAAQYLEKHPNVDRAAKSFINHQIAKCTTSGFLTGLGGIITLPVTIPANVGSVLYVQMRMIACLAYMGGYDTHSDQVQTLVYACLAGISVDQVLKKTGTNIGKKVAMEMIKKIPGEVLTNINKKVGFRLVTKFGSEGAINLVKIVPVVGGVVGGGYDFAETKAISSGAYRMFIKGNFH